MPIFTKTKASIALDAHFKEIYTLHMRDLFNEDKTRFDTFSIQSPAFLFDFSKNRITTETVELLCQLATEMDLQTHIDAMLAGEKINNTENRAALHTALRSRSTKPLNVNGENIREHIALSLQKIETWVDAIREGRFLGCTGKPLQNIVNIGIGGSDLGPYFTTEALAHFQHKDLTVSFISNIDGAHVHSIIDTLDPETTLFIVSSKTFSTIETLTNATIAKDWLKAALPTQPFMKHFIGITSNSEKATAFGLLPDQTLPMWDWVGGRYSIWSAIGLPLAISIGMDNFRLFLQGAEDVDTHFQKTPFHQNIPVLMALLGIWYSHYFNAETQAVIPYAHLLGLFPKYLQQCDMESNGKSVSKNGEALSFSTGAILFGEQGCNGQHAFYQSLHQGTHLTPIDFILVAHNPLDIAPLQDLLVASGLSQAQALMQGETKETVLNELTEIDSNDADFMASHKQIAGNKPSTILFLAEINPYTIGSLIATYEHKIFAQSVIWGINPFDQWGVELGKSLLPPILKHLENDTVSTQFDSSTNHLIDFYHTFKDAK